MFEIQSPETFKVLKRLSSFLRQEYPPILTSGETLPHPGGWDKPIREVIPYDFTERQRQTLVYMWIEPYQSHSLCKSFQTMVCVIRLPMQWRPSNRKLSVCLSGNEINKAYSNIKIDCWTLDLVLFCDTFEFGAAICRLLREGIDL